MAWKVAIIPTTVPSRPSSGGDGGDQLDEADALLQLGHVAQDDLVELGFQILDVVTPVILVGPSISPMGLPLMICSDFSCLRMAPPMRERRAPQNRASRVPMTPSARIT